MNYRHSFHAGNFADVFKHVLLIRLLLYLKRKDKSFRFIDTHAGAGSYNLNGPDSQRSGEWRAGIGAILDLPKDDPAFPLLQDYLNLVGPLVDEQKIYPGSPALAKALLREGDRALLYESQPVVFGDLARLFAQDKRFKCLNVDGYIALKAAIPPPERRGLTLIDPPFENCDEFLRLAAAMTIALRKWPEGVYALWRPIKDLKASEQFVKTVCDCCSRDILDLQIRGRLSHDDHDKGKGVRSPLNRTGMLIVNPPYSLKEEAQKILPALAKIFSPNGEGACSIRYFPAKT